MLYSAIDNIIKKCNKEPRIQKVRRAIFPVTVIVLWLIYYFPFYSILLIPNQYINDIDQIWDKIYLALNPFTVAPFLAGIFMLLIFLLYNSWILKCGISIFYGLGVLVSLVAIMGMTSVWEFMYFSPHVVIIVLACMILARRRKVLNKQV